MNLTTEGMTRFLEGVARAISDRSRKEDGVQPFITISRQAGAGGHSIAQSILEKTLLPKSRPVFGGWALFNQRLADVVAENPLLKVSPHGLVNEDFSTEFQDLMCSWIGGLSPQSEIVGYLFKVVRGLASQGRVIIVGRAGACLTRHLPGGLHLRLVASEESRVRRLVTLTKRSEKFAANYMVEKEKARARLIKSYFQRDINDPLLYDMVLNTDTLSTDTIANMVLRALEAVLKAQKE